MPCLSVHAAIPQFADARSSRRAAMPGSRLASAAFALQVDRCDLDESKKADRSSRSAWRSYALLASRNRRREKKLYHVTKNVEMSFIAW